MTIGDPDLVEVGTEATVDDVAGLEAQLRASTIIYRILADALAQMWAYMLKADERACRRGVVGGRDGIIHEGHQIAEYHNPPWSLAEDRLSNRRITELGD